MLACLLYNKSLLCRPVGGYRPPSCVARTCTQSPLSWLPRLQTGLTGSGDEDDLDSYGNDGNHEKVSAGVTGTVWEIKAEVGQEVKAGDTLVSRHSLMQD